MKIENTDVFSALIYDVNRRVEKVSHINVLLIKFTDCKLLIDRLIYTFPPINSFVNAISHL